MNPDERMEWLEAAKDLEDLARRYDQWAPTYEAELRESFGRSARAPIVDVFARYVPRTARILDAGAGTGVAGVWLAEMGYTDLVGLDISSGMLDIARSKGVYRELHQMALGRPLSFPDDAFDAAIAVGVFTEAHAPVSAFDELIRVVRPGGYILSMLEVAFGDDPATQAVLRAFEDAGQWQLVEVDGPSRNNPDAEIEIRMRTHVYRVCPAKGTDEG